MQEEEEEDAPAPVRKKSRPSLETEDEDFEPEEAPRPRTRKPSSRASTSVPSSSTARKARGSAASVKAESADISVPRRKTVTPASATKRSSRRSSTIVIGDDDEDTYEIDENGEAKPLKPPPKAAPARGKRVKEKTVYVIDDSSDDEETKPKARARGSARNMTPVKEEVAQEDEADDVKQEEELKEEPKEEHEDEAPAPLPVDDEEDDEEDEAVTAAVLDEPESRPHTPVAEPFEEEHSLLDPPFPASPRKAAQAAPPPEELSGPKPRLVIHKLVLVNFKSYAGRQEIGPFHKVDYHCIVIIFDILNHSISLSPPSLDPTVLESPIRLMRFSSCSGTVPPRCDRESSRNLSTTLRIIPICRSAASRFTFVR